MIKQIDERLRTEYSQLTPQEQRVAQFITEHMEDLISYNSTELARLAGVSKATVSRLFKRLGYTSYRAMREEFRALRQTGIPVTAQRNAVSGNVLLERHYKQEMANLTHWVQQLSSAQFDTIIQQLSSAHRVVLAGFRNSYPVALHMRSQLMHIRQHVSIIPQPGQTLAEEIVDLTEQDMVVVIGFRRRPYQLQALLRQLKSRHVPVLLICEPQAQALIALSQWHLCVPLDSVSAFDSYSSAMSLVNLLSNALLHTLLPQGRQRIHQISDTYQMLNELDVSPVY